MTPTRLAIAARQSRYIQVDQLRVVLGHQHELRIAERGIYDHPTIPDVQMRAGVQKIRFQLMRELQTPDVPVVIVMNLVGRSAGFPAGPDHPQLPAGKPQLAGASGRELVAADDEVSFAAH